MWGRSATVAGHKNYRYEPPSAAKLIVSKFHHGLARFGGGTALAIVQKSVSRLADFFCFLSLFHFDACQQIGNLVVQTTIWDWLIWILSSGIGPSLG